MQNRLLALHQVLEASWPHFRRIVASPLGVWTVTPLCLSQSQLERIYSCLMLPHSTLELFSFFNLILLKDN